MNNPGATEDLLVRARSALLDALEALGAHREAIVVIGAQAIYLRTAGAPVAVAEATKDSDLAIDPRLLGAHPLVEEAMRSAGFHPDTERNQPGAWLNGDGIPVDLMVPEALAGEGGKNARGARIPPHDKRVARRARGLEAAVVDNDWMLVAGLHPNEHREYNVRVAGPAALVVAKIHKIAERAESSPARLVDKDAHDIYRILLSTQTEPLSITFRRLLMDDLAQEVTAEALEFIRTEFAAGPAALGSVMAGRAEEGIGDPEPVALQTSILASDLINAIGLV